MPSALECANHMIGDESPEPPPVTKTRMAGRRRQKRGWPTVIFVMQRRAASEGDSTPWRLR